MLASSEQIDTGEFKRQKDHFTGWVAADGSTEYPAESGRYHLYVSLACPWAHRTVIVRKLKRLEEVVGMTVVDPIRDDEGWAFRDGEGYSEDPPYRIVILGGGFGGLYAAKQLGGRRGVEVAVVDRRNFHLFQPLLYQVATGGLSPGDIASPIRAVLARHTNIRVLTGHASGIDVAERRLILKDGEVAYWGRIGRGRCRALPHNSER